MGIHWESVGWNPTAAWPAALRRPSSSELQFWPGLGPLIRTGCSKDCQGPCNHARLLSTSGTDSLHRAAPLSLWARTPYRVVERRTGRGQESGFRSQRRPRFRLYCLRRWMRTLRSEGRENRGCLSPGLPVGSFFRLLPSLRPLTRDYIVAVGTLAPYPTQS